jgi:DNA replication and repair protein RecF
VLVTGANGAGKTNLLEALHVGTQGFSPRARADAQMIRFGAENARVGVAGARVGRRVQVDVTLAPPAPRRARLNGSSLQSPEELRGVLQTLVFTPDRLAVVKGGPAARRAYLDRSLGRLYPSRLRMPSDYAAAVGQRNAALRRVAAGSSSPDALAPWTGAVAELGARLVEARRETLSLVAPAFERHAERLGLSAATAAYEGDAPTVDELEKVLSRDLERGTTSLGPHLHEVRLEARGRELRSFGSQGEQRIAVLALVLAESDLIAERTGAPPLVLLDDVLSELDRDRRLALRELIATNGQTVVTATAAEALPGDPAQLLVVTPGNARSA